MTDQIKTNLSIFLLLTLAVASVTQARTFEVSPNSNEGSEGRQDEIISRFEARFSSINPAMPTNDDFEVVMGLNYSLERRTKFPTGELAQRAETLSNELGNFFDRNPRYPDVVKAKVLELNRLKEAQKAPTYETDIIRAFRLVEFLPTPEVVIMLGSLLEYDEGYFVDGHLTKAIERKSIAARAMETINRYPLIEPELKIDPSNIKLAYPDVLVPQWQAWWQEIVDGERVFQLEGDPTRYNHLGPVSADWKPKSASRATATPSAQAPSRTSPPRTTPSPENQAQENRFLWASLALVVIALLAWAKTRFQKKRTKSF